MSILKSLRESANLTQYELAELSGVARGYISHLETNRVKGDEEVLNKLSSVLAEFIDLAYVAGLFDRQSSITTLKIQPKNEKDQWGGGWVKGPGYICRVEFRSIHKIFINTIQNIFKIGSISKLRYRDDKPMHVFMAWSDSAEVVLEKLLPYLRLKRKNAELLLELRKLQKGNRKLTWTKVDLEKFNRFKELDSQGKSIMEIARKLDMGHSTVSSWRKRLKREEPFVSNTDIKYQKYLKRAEEIHLELRRK